MNKMKRKNFDEDSMAMEDFRQWFMLQDTRAMNEANLKKMRSEEKKWVKEGICEECGAYDVLSKFKNSFVCSACINNLNGNGNKKK